MAVRVIPLGPEGSPCEHGHCMHQMPEGLLCCRCPVRVHGIRLEFEEKDCELPSTYYPHTPLVRPFRKRMQWPWPCQMGRCGPDVASDPTSYYCDEEVCVGLHNLGEPPYVVGMVVIDSFLPPYDED